MRAGVRRKGSNEMSGIVIMAVMTIGALATGRKIEGIILGVVTVLFSALYLYLYTQGIVR